MKINDWLKSSVDALEANGVDNARLDCLIILEAVIGKNRSLILAHPDQVLSLKQISNLTSLLNRRKNREPLAYILNTKEFYNYDFFVDQNVLIPRPASEDIIDLFGTIKLKPNQKVADIGTGSGALAITISRLYPELNVDAFDISKEALNIAKINIKKHNSKVKIHSSDLLSNIHGPYKVIVANLPYVAKNKKVSKEVMCEPNIALYAEDNGLSLIYKLLDQINSNALENNGYIILEADIEQHNLIIEYAKKLNIEHVLTKNLSLLFVTELD